MNDMYAWLDEDEPTRRNRDAATANRIAAALVERFGYVSLHLRYELADQAIAAARAEATPIGERIRQFDAMNHDEQIAETIRAIKANPMTLEPDPPQPDWEVGERP